MRLIEIEFRLIVGIRLVIRNKARIAVKLIGVFEYNLAFLLTEVMLKVFIPRLLALGLLSGKFHLTFALRNLLGKLAVSLLLGSLLDFFLLLLERVVRNEALIILQVTVIVRSVVLQEFLRLLCKLRAVGVICKGTCGIGSNLLTADIHVIIEDFLNNIGIRGNLNLGILNVLRTTGGGLDTIIIGIRVLILIGNHLGNYGMLESGVVDVMHLIDEVIKDILIGRSERVRGFAYGSGNGFLTEIGKECGIRIVFLFLRFFIAFLILLKGDYGSGIHDILGIELLILDGLNFNEDGLGSGRIIGFFLGKVSIGHIRFEIRIGRIVILLINLRLRNLGGSNGSLSGSRREERI